MTTLLLLVLCWLFSNEEVKDKEKASFGGPFYIVRAMLGELRGLMNKTTILEVFGQLLELKRCFLERFVLFLVCFL